MGALLEITNYTYSGGSLVGTTNYFPQFDGNGNVAALVRSDGLTAAVYEYGPFGELLRNEAFDSAIADNPFRFSTKFLDLETGLVNYGNRYYSPSLGRFINRDPIEEAGGLNLYGFCGNDGINNFDVMGNSWLSKLWDRTVLSFSKHVAQNWDHGRSYVITAAAIVVAIITYGAASEWAAGEIAESVEASALADGATVSEAIDIGAAAASSTVGTTIAGVVGGAAAGAASAAVATTLSGGNLNQVLHSVAMGAISGAIMGGVSGYYGNSYPVSRIPATALGSGLASSATGGNFKKGFEVGGIQGLMAYGWNQMRNYTDSVAKDEAAYERWRLNYDSRGSILSIGDIDELHGAPSAFGRLLDKIFTPLWSHLETDSPQGLTGQYVWETSIPTWLGGGTDGVINGFINDVSKVHDFYEGWNYGVQGGVPGWWDRGAAFNSLYEIYGVAGMAPCAVYTWAALNPTAPYFAQSTHR